MASSSSTTSYIQGHHESVTRSHAVRTAEDSAAFLLPYLRKDMHILDVGCGPGSISYSFCKYTPEGSVIGVDVSESVLDQARATAKGVQNINFQMANVVEGLPFADETFDVVYCHQVMFHISTPVIALKEMRRVCKAGGMVACREGDWGAYINYPPKKGLELYHEVYARMVRADGNEPNAGRHLHTWARQAGFDPLRIQKGASTTHFSTDEDRKWYANMMADRWTKSEIVSKAQGLGVTDEQVAEIIDGFTEWANDEDGWMTILQGEVICIR